MRPDQDLLVETVDRLAASLAAPPPVTLPHTVDDPAGWSALVSTGLVGMHLAETEGGGSAHSIDTALTVERFGAHLCLVPFLGQGVLGPELMRRAGADPAELLRLAGGSVRVTVGLEPGLERIASVGDDGLAIDARGATHALVLDGDRVVTVAVGAPVEEHVDVTRVLARLGDGPSIGVGRLLPDDAVRFEAFALAMVAADLVGVAGAALAAACDYVVERRQFGVPVATFQAVQHLAADALVSLEAARSSMWFGAWAADELPPAEALLAARQAKVTASRAALEIVEIQTQLFGGIAITWEERAHLRVRRVLFDRLLFGDEHRQLDAIAATRLDGEG